MRDYEKYIARQFKRGASRQELNVSWLKKNELDLRRHVAELRDSIRKNWSSTGMEVGKDLRQFLQGSRPNSPAPGAGPTGDSIRSLGNATIPHLQHLEIPGTESGRRTQSPRAMARNEDFATGYSFGLIGGVKSWVSYSYCTGRKANCPDMDR